MISVGMLLEIRYLIQSKPTNVEVEVEKALCRLEFVADKESKFNAFDYSYVTERTLAHSTL